MNNRRLVKSVAMQSANFTNQFLIAMPVLTDPHFAKSLVYICEHNENGALGVIVNRPIDMTLGNLFERVDTSVVLLVRECAHASAVSVKRS